MKKQLIWVFEWRKSVHYWRSYILFAPECKELTCMLDPLLYRWGVPPVVIRCVQWTMQRGVPQTCINIQGPVIVMFFSFFFQFCILNNCADSLKLHKIFKLMTIPSGNAVFWSALVPFFAYSSPFTKYAAVHKESTYVTATNQVCCNHLCVFFMNSSILTMSCPQINSFLWHW